MDSKGYRWVALAVSVAFGVWDRLEPGELRVVALRARWKGFARVARWCGEQAIEAEQSYYQEVRQ